MKTIQLALILLIVGCASTLSDAVVNLKIIAPTQSTEIGNALTIDGIEFLKAKVVIQEIEFKLAQNCNQDDNELEVDYEGPYVVNLLNGSSTPDLGQIDLNPGPYCEIEFEIEAYEIDNDDNESLTFLIQDSEMNNLSLLIEGLSPESIPFTLRFEEDEEFELESTNALGFELKAGTANELLLALDIRSLFNNITFTTLIQNGGEIEISKDSNEDAYDQIALNIKQIAKLFEKNNDNPFDDDDLLAQ